MVHVNASSITSDWQIKLSDPHLKPEIVFTGIKFPSSMDFVAPNDILVLEKNNGTVKRIVNGNMLPEALLEVNVSSTAEGGMLGIAVAKQANHDPTYVFLFFTETEGKKDKDGKIVQSAVGNRLYRYELLNNKLANPKLLLDLPVASFPIHNGGKIAVGPDSNVYVVVGDGNVANTIIQNIENGTKADGRGGILRVTQDGKVVDNGILGSSHPLNLYYAYGIRNSFGLDFDPLTGKLWDTENGPSFGDEINLVEPGFNSGWKKNQGIWKNNNSYMGEAEGIQSEELVEINNKGKYSAPEFTWNETAAVTGLSFFRSDKLGTQYDNDLFVGDFKNGNIYNFQLNNDRTKFILKDILSDKVAKNTGELNDILFGQGFGGITDIKTGPDGQLYILSINGHNCPGEITASCIPYDSGAQGTIFRIVRDNWN